MASYFTRRKIARMWQEPRHAAFVAYEEARNIIVLTDESFEAALSELSAQWAGENRRVTWAIYPARRRANPSPHHEIIEIPRRWLGLMPSKKRVGSINALEADVLIDLTNGRYPAMQYLAACNKARMKIGVVDATQHQHPPYDLTIRCNDRADTKKCLQEILFYWSKVDANR